MPEQEKTPRYISDHIRRVLKDGGSAPHAQDVQRFFKEEVQSRGWYTQELRKLAHRFRRTILQERGQDFLVQVADQLFRESVMEEKNFAVFLLEKNPAALSRAEFELFESWLDRVENWSDHDALVHYLIAPMLAANAKWSAVVFRWAKSKNRWRRRAACVALIQGTRRGLFFPEIVRLSDALLDDEDDMVQKGLGWLLRETAKFNADEIVPYLFTIQRRAPRLVLRTACETLPPKLRTQILAKT
jgi:3-methyladenine DNA glycosylase AlkD